MNDTLNWPCLPQRSAESHKGTYGTVGLMGGQATMIGAVGLAARAALRCGVGRVQLAVDPALRSGVLSLEPSATALAMPEESDHPMGLTAWLDQLRTTINVWAVGPGWGVGEVQRLWLDHWLNDASVPLVLDADGLNNLSHYLSEQNNTETVQREQWILTPHPGEYRRLAEALGWAIDLTTDEQRQAAAIKLAVALNAVVVLKGPRTVVTDGQSVYVNQTGNALLATAGTGDVLTGVISGLVAQGMGLYEASVAGVAIHGMAADLWLAEHGAVGMLARELADQVPVAIQRYQAKCLEAETK